MNIAQCHIFNKGSRYSADNGGVARVGIKYIDVADEDVTLSDIHIYHQGGYTEADGLLTPPEQEKVYPEPWMFGTIPAKGFYIRHARNITLDLSLIHIFRRGNSGSSPGILPDWCHLPEK